MVKAVIFGKADWGYFVDVQGDTPSNSYNIGIYQYKKEARKEAREKAKEFNVDLISDWGIEKQQSKV